MKNFEEQKKIDDLMAAAMLADESGKVMNGVNPHSILALFDLLRDQNNRAVTSEVKFKEMLAAEHRLSDAYIRIREICGTIFLPPGSDIWKETEKAACSMADLRNHLFGQKPLAWINEDELPEGYPYDAMFPYSQVDIVRMFPVFGPSIAAVPAVADDELRAQGVDIMKAKTLQSMQRTRNSFDDETWEIAEQCLLGLIDGCGVVAKELRTGTLPDNFRPNSDGLDAKRLAFIASLSDDTAPQQYESIRKGD